MPGGWTPSSEDPAYYDAIAGGSGYGMANTIADSAVAGVAAPLILRNQKKAAEQEQQQKMELGKSLYDAIVAQGEDESVARTVALEYVQKGTTALQTALSNVRKAIDESKLNTAKIGTENATALDKTASANKSNVDATLAPGIAESEAGYKSSLGTAATENAKAANLTAGANVTKAQADLRESTARIQGMTGSEIRAQFDFADTNRDGKIDGKEMAKLVESEFQKLKNEDTMGDTPNKDLYETAKKNAVEIANLKVTVRQDLPNLLSQVSAFGTKPPDAMPSGPVANGGGADTDTKGAIDQVTQWQSQYTIADKEAALADLRAKFPNMDEAKVRQSLGM